MPEALPKAVPGAVSAPVPGPVRPASGGYPPLGNKVNLPEYREQQIYLRNEAVAVGLAGVAVVAQRSTLPACTDSNGQGA